MNDERSDEDSLESATLPIREQLGAFQELAVHVGTRKQLRVETRCACHESLNGYLLGLSNELGLMHCFHDFLPDGYTIFRLTDVTGIRSDEYERLWDRMLAAEGSLGGLLRKVDIDLGSVDSAIDSLSAQFQKMIIEVEIPGEGIDEFYIGQVKSLDAIEVHFDHFDALGRWEREPAVISLNEIAFVQFETPYINTFWKYLDDFEPAKAE